MPHGTYERSGTVKRADGMASAGRTQEHAMARQDRFLYLSSLVPLSPWHEPPELIGRQLPGVFFIFWT